MNRQEFSEKSRYSTLEKMEHECIIGMYNDYEDTDLCTFSELQKQVNDLNLAYKKYAVNREVFKKTYTIAEYCEKNTNLKRFAYCPECGKKIDWNELKRKGQKNI